MFLLFAEKAAEAGEQVPAVVRFVNHYVGEPAYNFEMKYTYPLWKSFFAYFGTTPEKVFGGPYTPETAVPSNERSRFWNCSKALLTPRN